MRTTCVLIACWACVGHGRRMQVKEDLQNDQEEQPSSRRMEDPVLISDSLERQSEHWHVGASNPLKALARLLLRSDHLAGWHISGEHGYFSVKRPADITRSMGTVRMGQIDSGVGSSSRRAAFLAAAAAAATSWHPAIAFENRLDADDGTPRTPGPKPRDLGPRDGNKLKPCTDGKPHCLSSNREVKDTDVMKVEVQDDEDLNYPKSLDWVVEPFKYEKPLAEAVEDLKAAIAAYPPGQRGIDGGGFKLITEKTETDYAYLYVQFESKIKGYIDDMEFALGKGVANVRTSSRQGYLDKGVNAKRFNWFVDRLGRLPGWKTVQVLAREHPLYFELNGIRNTDVVEQVSDGGVRKERWANFY